MRRAVQASPASASVAATRSASTGSSSRRSRRSRVFTGSSAGRLGSGLSAFGRRFIDDAPKYAELFHGRDELLKLDGLDHIRVGAERIALGQIAFFPG